MWPFNLLSQPPRWKDADPGKRLAAVRELKDQNHLAEIARRDPDEFIRIAAAERVLDATVSQILLEQIAEGSRNDPARFAAATRLGNENLAQAVFREIAAKGRICWLRLAAAKRITDKTLAQAYFRKMAENKDYYYKAVRVSAARMLKDKRLAKSILAKLGATGGKKVLKGAGGEGTLPVWPH